MGLSVDSKGGIVVNSFISQVNNVHKPVRKNSDNSDLNLGDIQLENNGVVAVLMGQNIQKIEITNMEESSSKKNQKEKGQEINKSIFFTAMTTDNTPVKCPPENSEEKVGEKADLDILKEIKMIEDLPMEDLALKFDEKYEFFLEEKYLDIILKDLRKIFSYETAELVYEQILLEHKRKQEMPKITFKQIFTKFYRLRLIVAIICGFFFQASGYNFFMFYSVKIFDEINDNGQQMNLVIT